MKILADSVSVPVWSKVGIKMADKQTSDKLSKIAATYIRLGDRALHEYVQGGGKLKLTGIGWSQFADDVRSLAASVLSQDEVKGQKDGGQHPAP